MSGSISKIQVYHWYKSIRICQDAGHHSRIVIVISQVQAWQVISDIKQVSGDNIQESGVK